MFITRFQDFHLEKSMAFVHEAEEFDKAGLPDNARQALYMAVDTHLGNWEALLRWGLALLDGAGKEDRDKGLWAIGENCLPAIVLPDDPRGPELVRRLALGGHTELANAIDANLDARLKTARMALTKSKAATKTSDVVPSHVQVPRSELQNLPTPESSSSTASHSHKTSRHRDAYVTLVSTPSYGMGAMVLGLSIRDVEATRRQRLGEKAGEERALVALVTEGSEMDETVGRLIAVGYEVIRVESLSCATLKGGDARDGGTASRLRTACSKLHIFNLTQFRAVVYLDADTLVMHESAATLFDHYQYLTIERPLAAAPECLAPSLFNSGVLVLRPSAELFASLRDGLGSGAAYDGTDQGYLNSIFSDWFSWDANHRLSPRFNFAQHVASEKVLMKHYEREGDGIAIMHFLGSDKPWLSDTLGTTGKGLPKIMEPYYLEWHRFSKESWALQVE
jgi:glycogenin glucosyltransferase